MKNTDIIALTDAHIMPTYGRFPVAFERGSGSTLYDFEGKAYLDMTSGIGVNSLGFSDPGWVGAVTAQAAKVQHVSNLFYSPVREQLAGELCKATGMSKIFFANSGAEANECAIKIARKYSFDKGDTGRNEIITLVNSFHGRTVTTLSATGQDSFHNYFFPFTGGFKHAIAGDIGDLKAKIDGKTCAVMLEIIQGEGGVVPLPESYLKAVETICRERDILLMIDEVQTGAGRTGKLFAYEHFGIKPDVITIAKGIGGGLPIGACLCSEKLGGVLSPGTHGTTYGGNPVACAGALYTLKKINTPEFLSDIAQKGGYLVSKLNELPEVAGVDGIGLMLGINLRTLDSKTLVTRCVQNGLLALTAKEKLRFLPPLNITYEQIDRAVELLAKSINDLM